MDSNGNMIRDLKLDNLRGLAILFIVLGHFISHSPFWTSVEYSFIYRFIFLFHLPLLIFVSGYLSKAMPESSIKAFKTILIPYLIFGTFWIIFLFLKDGNINTTIFIVPAWGLWYLLCLYFWRVFLPTAARIKYIFTISIIAALLIGVLNFNSTILSISRAFCFFPLFLLGFYFKDVKDKFIINKYLATCVFFALLTVTALFLMPMAHRVFFFKYSYHAMDMRNLLGMVVRLLILLVEMVGVILLFNMMTTKRTILTRVGKNSLPVYVLHFYFVLAIPYVIELIGLGSIFNNLILTSVYIVVATGLVTFLLSREKVNDLTQLLIKTVANILIKKEHMDNDNVSNKKLV